MMCTLLLLLLLIVLMVHRLLVYRYRYWHDRGVPYAKPHLIYGNTRSSMLLKSTQTEALQALYHQFPNDDYLGVYTWWRPALMLRAPHLIKTLLVKDFVYFHDRGIAYDEVKDPLTANVFNLQGSRWRDVRASISPMFTTSRLRGMVPLVTSCVGNMLVMLTAAMGAPGPAGVDIRDIMARFTMDVIGVCAFGLDLGTMRDPRAEFREKALQALRPSVHSALLVSARTLWPGVVRALRLRQFSKCVTRFYIDTFRAVMEQRTRTGQHRDDMVQQLVTLRRRHAYADDGVLTAQAFSFFIAGFETSSLTITFCLYELAHHPELQRRLRDEIDDAVLANAGTTLSYDALQQLRYMDQVVAETLRKYPVSSVVFRVCTAKYQVPGTKLHIDPGTPLLVPIYALHKDPKYFPQPELFNPDRFSKDAKPPEPFSYLPFGDGPRVCVGRRFALLLIKVALVHVLHQYEVHICDRTVPIRFNPQTFSLQPVDTIYLQFVPVGTTTTKTAVV